MDGDGWTGLDLEQAQRNIFKFLYSCYLADSDMLTINSNFFDALSKFWASPNAVDFYKRYNQEIVSLITEFRNNTLTIMRNAVGATKIMANSQMLNSDNLSFELEPYFNKEVPNFTELLQEREVNGGMLVGMNKRLVSIAKQTYITDFAKIKDDLSKIPTDIALYDPDNSLNSTFRMIVDAFWEKISRSYNQMMNSITKAIEAEEDMLEMAKNQAVDTFRA